LKGLSRGEKSNGIVILTEILPIETFIYEALETSYRIWYSRECSSENAAVA
jgi:hypothetical protein